MRHATPEEFHTAMRIRKVTGKNLQTCLFCLRLLHGNYAKAVKFCGEDNSEDGRQRTILV